MDLFFATVDQCLPKQKSSKKVDAPWISKDLISLCGRKGTDLDQISELK